MHSDYPDKATTACTSCDEMFQECISNVDPDSPTGYAACQLLWNNCKKSCSGESTLDENAVSEIVQDKISKAAERLSKIQFPEVQRLDDFAGIPVYSGNFFSHPMNGGVAFPAQIFNDEACGENGASRLCGCTNTTNLNWHVVVHQLFFTGLSVYATHVVEPANRFVFGCNLGCDFAFSASLADDIWPLPNISIDNGNHDKEFMMFSVFSGKLFLTNRNLFKWALVSGSIGQTNLPAPNLEIPPNACLYVGPASLLQSFPAVVDVMLVNNPPTLLQK